MPHNLLNLRSLKKFFRHPFILLISGFWLPCALAATQPKPLRFAMEASYPPFTFFNRHNQISGFEIEIAQALCQLLERPCTFQHQSFDSLLLNLKFHRSDAIISALDITPARARQVAFTQPYYQNSATFVILNGQINTIDKLRQQRVGVQRGTTHQNYLLAKHPDIQTVAYDSYQNALLDLQHGRIQAIFADSAIAQHWCQQQPLLSRLGKTISDPDYFGVGLAIAVRPEDTQLLQQLNQALTRLKQQGKWQAITQKWFH
ncbi:MAG: transporter substrate-binding domain-containing protein [Candidatus Symbiodolus clandestinus]